MPKAVPSLRDAAADYARLGISVRRVLTDNGSPSRSRYFASVCPALGIRHKFTRTYMPQTNVKAEGFMQSALRDWAYGWTYQNSNQRVLGPESWQTP